MAARLRHSTVVAMPSTFASTGVVSNLHMRINDEVRPCGIPCLHPSR